jgi:hypothetical protein
MGANPTSWWPALLGGVAFFFFAPATASFIAGGTLVAAVVYYASAAPSTGPGLTELLWSRVARLLPATAADRTLTRPAPPRTVEDVQLELRHAGLEKCQLVLGIDYTKSNTWTGKRTFGGYSLHALQPGMLNPYQSVIQAVGETLAAFDDDGQVPVYGFGDKQTRDRAVLALAEPPPAGFEAVLECYTRVTPTLQLDGPTSLVPLLHEAMRQADAADEGTFTLLVIITDGAVTDPDASAAAVVEASRHPLGILVIGVGDGPWDTMEEFDDALPARQFDNFTFVDFDRIMRTHDGSMVAFAADALREAPAMYREAQRLGLLRQSKRAATRVTPTRRRKAAD